MWVEQPCSARFDPPPLSRFLPAPTAAPPTTHHSHHRSHHPIVDPHPERNDLNRIEQTSRIAKWGVGGTALFSQVRPTTTVPLSIRSHCRAPQHHFLKRLDGVQIQQQNTKCKQFLLCTTRQAPENHGCTLCCDFSTPNPVVLFQLGQQCSLPCLDVQNIEPVFGFGGIVYVGPLQHVL